jgi:hypothetical protein
MRRSEFEQIKMQQLSDQASNNMRDDYCTDRAMVLSGDYDLERGRLTSCVLDPSLPRSLLWQCITTSIKLANDSVP